MGGHGGLNILPQKRWNVYRRDNREKVENDEAKLERARGKIEAKRRSKDLTKSINKLRGISEKEDSKRKSKGSKKMYAEENKLFEEIKREERKKEKEEQKLIMNALQREESKMGEIVNLNKKTPKSLHVNLFMKEELDSRLQTKERSDLNAYNAMFNNSIGGLVKDRMNPWYSKKNLKSINVNTDEKCKGMIGNSSSLISKGKYKGQLKRELIDLKGINSKGGFYKVLDIQGAKTTQADQDLEVISHSSLLHKDITQQDTNYHKHSNHHHHTHSKHHHKHIQNQLHKVEGNDSYQKEKELLRNMRKEKNNREFLEHLKVKKFLNQNSIY